MAKNRSKCSTCLHHNETLKRCAQAKPSDKLQEYVLLGTVTSCFMYESETGMVELREQEVDNGR